MYRQHGTFAKIGICFYTSKLFGIKMWKIIFTRLVKGEGEGRGIRKKEALRASLYYYYG